jgi:aryl-alcohol dehydrogenase-like predicted oxidoreductase
MEKRPLGRSGLAVAPLALGGNVFGWTADETTSFAILDRFVDAGFSLVDTANTYSTWVPGHKGGESETIIGNWLARGAGGASASCSRPRSAWRWAARRGSSARRSKGTSRRR